MKIFSISLFKNEMKTKYNPIIFDIYWHFHIGIGRICVLVFNRNIKLDSHGRRLRWLCEASGGQRNYFSNVDYLLV